MKCIRFTKASLSADHKKSMAGPPVKASPNDLGLVDNGDETSTVVGVDAAGKPVTLDPAAFTITAVSDNQAVVTTTVTGLTFGEHAATPAPDPGLTAGITLTLTATAGGAPIPALTWTDTIQAGPVSGIAINRGPVTTH
jgi:hypothetical protein